jgi:hypothetical protein
MTATVAAKTLALWTVLASVILNHTPAMATNPPQGAFITLKTPMLVCNAEDVIRRIEAAGSQMKDVLEVLSYAAPARRRRPALSSWSS